MSLLDIRPDHLKMVQDILQKQVPEREVWAFGSRAKWLAKEYSDLDLCIVGVAPLSFSTLGRLAEAFDESELPWKVDVVDWATTSESFRKIIERDKVVVQGGGQSLEMASEWKDCSLGDVVELKRGYDLPQKERLPGAVPLVSSSGVTDSHAKAMVKGPGVVTGRYGTLGQVFYVEQDFWPLNTTLYVRDFKGNDPRFISYFLRDVDFFAYSDKAAVPGLNRNHLHQAKVRFPTDLTEQRTIAHILGSLDDKIELNRRTNATLEAMARALFQSWFVDFEPVRAKMEGRKPVGLDPAIAALFPASFQDSEVGHIPKGWEARPLAELVEVVKGRSYRSEELAESKTALVTLKSFLRGGGYRTDGLKPFTGEYKSNQQVRPGDLVVAFTDVTQAADVIGKPALVRSDDRFETLVASLDVGIVRSKSKHVSVPFLYCLFLTGEFQAHTYSHSTGTTVLHLRSTAIPSFVSVIPPIDIAEKFTERAAPFFLLIEENAKQSRTLATLRDLLLPKLISGELRVNGTENCAEKVCV